MYLDMSLELIGKVQCGAIHLEIISGYMILKAGKLHMSPRK